MISYYNFIDNKIGVSDMTKQNRWEFWIDRGGTFTDIVAKRPNGQLVINKYQKIPIIWRSPQQPASI